MQKLGGEEIRDLWSRVTIRIISKVGDVSGGDAKQQGSGLIDAGRLMMGCS